MNSRSFNKNATRLENRFKRNRVDDDSQCCLSCFSATTYEDSCLNFLFFLTVANGLATNCNANQEMDWSDAANYPRPDFLSSSRKRLTPQLMFKGGILNAWGKKMAVALDSNLYATLPNLKEVPREHADIAWFVYDLIENGYGGMKISKTKSIYTAFSETLNAISQPKIGDVNDFFKVLQAKVDDKLETAPINQTIEVTLR
jgi:hypothetical protein